MHWFLSPCKDMKSLKGREHQRTKRFNPWANAGVSKFESASFMSFMLFLVFPAAPACSIAEFAQEVAIVPHHVLDVSGRMILFD